MPFRLRGLDELFEQRLAGLGNATVMFVAAAGVGMRGLGQVPKRGNDLGRFERSLYRQVQYLAVLRAAEFKIWLKSKGSTSFLRLEAQIVLILLPSLLRHDEAFAG